ncbi:transporter substrate-binding domain-containing protein [Rhodospira trueperi]|uniref:transporter substrate-binding domain-containing protein n=1 Tax=Rhodospira trueperi TaxID=69960 RepID=UPI0015A2EEF2|nr:transporter substrate-binding domain-containing protein [Rhodospira trueperi]
MVALLLLLGLAATDSRARAVESLRVGSELDYPPFAMVDDSGAPTGFSVDLFRAVAEVMDLDVTFTVGPWNELLEDLRAGRLDALPFVGIFPDRDEYLDFSVPVVVTHGAAFRRDDGPRIESDDDLADLRVAVMRDDVGHEYARSRPWGGDVETFDSLGAAFDCLAAAACDVVVAPRLQGLLLIKERDLDGIAPASLTLEGFSLAYAFAVRAGDAGLLAKLNGGLAIVAADGTLERLHRTWLPEIESRRVIPVEVLLPYATGGLAVFLLVVTVLYVRQRRATGLADTRGRSLWRQAEHLRQLAARLDDERARAEQARAEADALIRVMPDLFFRLDAEGRFVDLHDPDGLALRDLDHLRGQSLEAALPEDVAQAAREALMRMHETGEAQPLDYALDLLDGKTHNFQARLAPMEDGGSLAVIRDVTEERQREADVRRAAGAMATVSAAKSRFLATLSHELRTPLNAILGFSEVLSQEMFGPLGSDQYRQYAKDVHVSGQALLRLVDDLMDITRIDSGRLALHETAVDLGAVVSSKVAVLTGLASANRTEIRVIAPDHPVRLWADEGQVQRMVVNLLSNAVKFTEAGTVEVSIEDQPDAGVALVVADTGIGMSPDQVANLGDPFYQTSPDVARGSGGYGLGIALVKEMITLHGGRLDHESVLDVGTTARLIFPPDRRLSNAVVPVTVAQSTTVS